MTPNLCVAFDHFTISAIFTCHCVFIQAHRRYYAFDIHPGFWKCLEHLFQERRIVSIDSVRDELLKGEDNLTDWTKRLLGHFYFSTENPSIVTKYKSIMDWLDREERYDKSARDQFADSADVWLISCAFAQNQILVTEEVYNAQIRKRVPIPNVARQFGVETVITFTMLRRLGIQFDWNPSELSPTRN